VCEYDFRGATAFGAFALDVYGAFLDCDEHRKFSWCAVAEDLNETVVTWASGQPPSATPGTCLTALLAEGAQLTLEALACNSRRSYICEVCFFLPIRAKIVHILCRLTPPRARTMLNPRATPARKRSTFLMVQNLQTFILVTMKRIYFGNMP